MTECFNRIAQDCDCRVVVVSASGRIFTAGTYSGFLVLIRCGCITGGCEADVFVNELSKSVDLKKSRRSCYIPYCTKVSST